MSTDRSRAASSSVRRQSYERALSGKLENVTRVGAPTMLLSTVLWAVTPALACLLPEQEMTIAEQECCQKLAGQCGSAMMPSSHTCCQHPDEGETSVSPGAKYSAPRHFTVAVLSQAVLMPICPASISGHSLDLSAPQPEASPGCSSILRI